VARRSTGIGVVDGLLNRGTVISLRMVVYGCVSH
jgi:hypothetical protein